MKFFANIRRKLLKWRISREIYQKIFPHLNGHANHGYPFDSDEKMVRLHIRNNLQAGLNLRSIGEVAAKMPKAEGDAFRYIVYRDLNECMERYLEFARERAYNPTPDDYRFAAKAVQGAA